CGKLSKKVNLTTPTITFPGIKKYKVFSIVSERVGLEGLKSYNNDVKHGYLTPSLSNEDAEYLQLFEEEVEEQLKQRDQIRHWEILDPVNPFIRQSAELGITKVDLLGSGEEILKLEVVLEITLLVGLGTRRVLLYGLTTSILYALSTTLSQRGEFSYSGLSLKAKVVDVIECVNGRLKTHDKMGVWKGKEDLKCVFCKKVQDSHNHLFFECDFSSVIWKRLKDMVKLDHAPLKWSDIQRYVLSRPINKSMWSVLQRLVIGAAIYFEWKERNIRTFQDKIRNVDVVCNLIKDTVRLRVLSLSLKDFAQVCDAAKILEFHVVRSGGKRRFPFMMVEVSQKLNVLKIEILIDAIKNGRPIIFMGSKKTVNLNMRYVKPSTQIQHCYFFISTMDKLRAVLAYFKERWLKYWLKFVLDRKELTLTLDDCRTIFQLPQATTNNHEHFVAAPKFSEMIMQMLYCFVNNIHVDYANLLWEGLHYSLERPSTLIPYPRFTKLIVGKHKDEVGMKILSWMIIDEMKLTENYQLYATVFGVDVPMTQSQPIKSTQGTHRITSALRSPNLDTNEGESSAPRKSTIIRLHTIQLSLAEQKSRNELEAKQNVQKVEEHLIAEEIEKLVEGAENVENVKVDSSNLRQYDTQTVPGTRLEPMINKESPEVEITAAEQPVNVIEEEEESSEDDYELRRRKKGKQVEESRSTCTQ
ncbi:retrovirus-related pol polyprotein from transposon TNT 1-94, partial [Tanacetum coccineum]